MIRPAVPSAPDHYCRLFAPFDDGLPPGVRNQKLGYLARSMESNISPIPSWMWTSSLGAGYTYFGQFIDHDLTEDRTPLRLAGLIEPKDTENRRRCWLDLDSLYGHGPGCPLDKDLYESDGASFRLGKPRVKGQTFDVPLTKGRPRVADERNNENIIVRQVHAIFLKLHNVAVVELKRAAPRLPASELFLKAQERVRWQYQWLVRHDFLLKICNENVYEDVIKKHHRRIDWSKGFSIPIEFSQAAFRFGHSMVRFEYDLNNEKKHVQLRDLFGPMKKKALRPAFAVDWHEFMEPNKTTRIDTSIVKPLFGLRDEEVSHFVTGKGPHTSTELPFRTLYRGAANRLPSGQQVRHQLCPEAVIRLPKRRRYDPWEKLRTVGLENHTPLWYYILLEAEVDEIGGSLGTLGSRLVLEVIEGALLANRNSFLNRCGRNWEPPPWRRADGSEFQIKTLLDVAKVVGLARDRR